MKKINYKNIFNLNTKTILVVGGAGLIGTEVTKGFISLGANVIVLDNNKQKLSNMKKKINTKSLKTIHFDIKKKNEVSKKFVKIIKSLPRIDVYVNCSYPRTDDWFNNSFNKISYNSLKKNLDLHLVSYSWLSKEIANYMRKRKIKGTIINFASIYGLVGQNLNIYNKTSMKENMTYSIIKGGIINLTKQLASYYGKYNIRVNTISPGGIKGHVAGKSNKQDKKFVKQYNSQVPLKRMAEANEIVGAVIFLSSDASSYVTGSNIIVDGGWLAI